MNSTQAPAPAELGPALLPDPAPRVLRPVMVVPDFDRIGGYERQAFAMARHCVRAGIPTFVLTNNPWHHPPRERRDGVTIHRLDPLPRDRMNWFSLCRAFLLFLRAHRDDYDVIHCHALTFLSSWCVAIGKVLRKPVLVKVATEQDVRDFRAARAWSFRFFFAWLRRADRLLCVSESIQHEAVRCGFRAERTVLVPNGVDTEVHRPPPPQERTALRARLPAAPQELVFLYVGRLVARKGVDVLLHALARLDPALPVRLWIVGDGDQRGALTALAEQLGIAARVHFAGEHPDVRAFLGAADAFVFPSRLEGLPNALLEAMSSGLPSIAMRIGGCADVVTDGTGILLPPDDVAALAGALQRLACDAALRAELAVRGRARVVERFGFARVVDELQAVYRTVANTAP